MKALFLTTIGLFALICSSRAFDREIVKQVSHVFVNGSKVTQSDTLIIQVNNRMGEREIMVPYSKGDKVSIGDAWIEDLAGHVVRKLKGKEINDRSYISDISLYEDDFVKTFELRLNSYPYRIVYSTKISFSKSFGAVTIDCIDSRTPVRAGILIVEVPLSDSIKHKQSNAAEPRKEILGNTRRYTWEYCHKPPLHPEINSSENLSDAPVIRVVPLHFRYGEPGSFESWQTFGNWVYRLNKGKDQLPPSEQQKIDRLLSGETGQREKAEILYRYLQEHTRYINVSIKLGGLQTYPAAYVCERKYGDCKALTNYMQAMLKYAGIRSYYTLIHAGGQVVDLDPDFPSQAFNHVILTVPFEQDTVFLECTANNVPFGYLGTFTQGRPALLVDEHGSRIITTPSLTAGEVACSRNIRADLVNENVLLSSTQRGYDYEHSSYLANQVNKNLADQYIRRTILSGTYELTDYQFSHPDKSRAEIRIDAEIKMRNLSKQYGKNLVLSPFALRIPSYENPEKRTLCLQIDYPEHYTDTIVYKLPGTLANAPENISLVSPFGLYSLEFKVESDALVCHKRFLLHAGRYDLDEYKDFHRFITVAKNHELTNIYLETQ